MIQLPINSPLKVTIEGAAMASRDLAMKSAAFNVCAQLQKIKELDDHMFPVSKESISHIYQHQNKEHKKAKFDNVPSSKSASGSNGGSSNASNKGLPLQGNDVSTPVIIENTRDAARPGTTKRRQYYYKQISHCLKGKKPQEDDTKSGKVPNSTSPSTEAGTTDPVENNGNHEETAMHHDKTSDKVEDFKESYYLYAVHLKLTCAIPEDQNTRGRRIFSPEDSSQKFGILVQEEIPAIS